MKNYFLILCIAVFPRVMQAQTNLVSNPSFEYTTWDNTYITVLNFVDWITPPNGGSSPDGFKNYALGNCIPGGCWGNQHTVGGDTYAFAGEKFVGGVAYYIQGTQQNTREYIHQELNTELIAGHVYSIGMAIKFGSRMKYIIDSFGMFISDTAIGPTLTYPLYGLISATPQVQLTLPLADSAEWTVLRSDYTALGGEKYITIGNFTPDSLLNISINPLNDPSDTHLFAKYSSYFFIDSVFIVDYDTTSSSASVAEIKNFLSFILYPNPASDFVKIEMKEGVRVDEIILFDVQGRKVRNFPSEERNLDIQGISTGEYFLHVKTEMGTVFEKLRIE